ncbi:hypothetical protein Prudu_015530 [Prunus dulcis]|uniref:Uncharacterized protein n=1 Tax=Prunus dulcis TaxID=3755 RepID=A0A4Y1RKI7_PRUDU|nr:hypothetical protein Prudu_015530 [Prunus dulcis]
MRTLVMMNPIGVFGLVSGELSVLGCHYRFKDSIAKSVSYLFMRMQRLRRLSKIARSSEKWAYYRNYVVCLVCTQPVCICISHMQLHDDNAMQE